MLDNETKRRIDTARDILVGKVPDPKSQVEQITIALIYKFMDDMDAEAEELGGKRKFFSGKFAVFNWKKLLSPSLGGHEVLNLYAEAIDKMNVNENIPQLFRDIFKNAYLPYRDPETLKSFLKIIDDFNYDHSEKLGDAFEYLLSVLGSQGDAGQFRTPRNIIDLMVYLIDPKKNETILDPACGTAGFLISSYRHIVKNNSSSLTEEKENNFSFGNGDSEKYNGDKLTPDERKKLAVNIQGYDISPDMVRLSLVNLYLHGFTNPKIVEYDTLTSEEKWNEHADIILANPPFMSPKGGIKPHKRFSVESSRSEVLFVDYIAEHLTPNGRAAVIVPEGIIFQSGKSYKSLRKMLVKKYLYAVVSLPAGVFNPYSGVKTSILLIDKTHAKRTDKILFAKIDNDGFDLGAQRRANSKSELPAIANAIKEYVNCVNDGKEFNTDNFTNLVLATKEKIGENGDWGLSGERYKTIIHKLTKYNQIVLGELCETSSGGTPLKKEESYFNNGTIPWIKSGEVAQGYIYKSEEYITQKGLENSSAKIFPINTVLVAMYGATVGQVGILKFDATTNQAVCGIYPNDKILPEYLYNILKSKRQYLISLSSGGAQPNISQKIIRELIIPLPPLEIQKEIVAEIEGWQKIIDGARQVVENYKPQIQIDPSWEMVELGEVCEKITDGTHRTPNYTETGVPFLRVTDITLSNDGKKFISIDEHNELVKRCKPEKDDVLYSKNGTIGIAKLVDWDYEFSIFVSLALLKPKKEILLPKYLEIFLNSDNAMRQAVAHSKSGTVTNLHLIEIRQMKIPLPNLDTQKRIIKTMGNEFGLVESNKQIITIFEQKIKEKIASVWGE
jgi:type I restriction enzyme M protein